MTKRSASQRHAHSASTAHAHGRKRCLRVLRALSAFIDDELPDDVCIEIRRHLGDCPNCEDFVVSLRQTVALCRHRIAPTLSSADRARMREEILQTAGSR
ncbi:MAG TPA: zf-HC2 domain-containing protein [Nitrospira sp.]|jgi:anti-sigma factor RsiW|nr:zf-HC2 domain-containing protein [Nitrospira sp.]